MHITDIEIDLLLRQKSITDEWPWNTNDERTVDKNIKDIVAQLSRKLRVQDKTEYGHYGSGYASFVDCWLFRPDNDFRYRAGDNYHGLVVLFSRLSRFYVLGQGNKSWDKTSGGSYLPHFEFVDTFVHQPVIELIPKVETFLTERGLNRLRKPDLDTILPKGLKVPTVMAERVYRTFDSLFYWED